MNLIPYVDPIASLLGEWVCELNAYSILLRIAIAFLFAAVIGCERARKRHSAGLRTFILVSTASSIAMLLDQYSLRLTGAGSGPILSAAALIGIAIISGNSFLYSSRNQIKGLTTAVALWTCAVIGLAAGGGFYTVAAGGFAALLICLAVLPVLEEYLIDLSNYFEVHLELKNVAYLQDFITTIRRLGLKIDNIELNPAYVHSGLSVYSISFTITKEELRKYKKHSEIIEALGTLDYVAHIEEIV